MEFAISMGVLGWAVLILGALALGVVIAFVGSSAGTYEWLLNAVAGAAGAVVGSEFITGLRAWGPVVDGIALVPAVVGGLVLAVVVAAIARFAVTPEPGTHPMAVR